MKQMCLLFCLALLTAAGAKEEVFRVSKVGSDKTKLLDVFEKVKLLENIRSSQKYLTTMNEL